MKSGKARKMAGEIVVAVILAIGMAAAGINAVNSAVMCQPSVTGFSSSVVYGLGTSKQEVM